MTAKLQIFLKLVCLLFADHQNYFLTRTQLLISGKPISQYASYLFIFSPLQMENSMKSIFTINPAIIESMECLIIRTLTQMIDLKVGVLLDLYRYASFRFQLMLGNIPSKM